MKLNVGILNDSFPPTLDGVTNAAVNYADMIHQYYGKATVITPKHPGAEDDFPYDIYRYKSFVFDKKDDYRFGWPFKNHIREDIQRMNFDIIHCHTPLASGYLSRLISENYKVPFIATYHTKYDYDIDARIPTPFLKKFAKQFIVNNMNLATEVWAVSDDAGKNLQSLGYQGYYRVVPNGVDIPQGKVSQEEMDKVSYKHNLQPDVPVFLFVGRQMWYKNLKVTFDALAILKAKNIPFYLLLIGKGTEQTSINRYIEKCGIEENTIHVGTISDREILRAYYSRADLFLFPSLFDSHGLVVREAAACACPSILVEGSSSAEGFIDNRTAFLAENNAESFASILMHLCNNKDLMRSVGEKACQTMYLSWQDAVGMAYNRYMEICDTWPYPLPYRNQKVLRSFG